VKIDAHHAAGDADLAQATWRQALTILDELDHPEAGEVRSKLQPATTLLAA
jgi:hypothetical protein